MVYTDSKLLQGDASILSFVRRWAVSRSRARVGPSDWQNVDRADLSTSAQQPLWEGSSINLISAVKLIKLIFSLA